MRDKINLGSRLNIACQLVKWVIHKIDGAASY